ncbi:hypothetical protein Pmani_037099 [Petrolisthes manimaculis]|uniref:Uncharacterized protein n=1 Tax=Petrolisthes manimaculis TaxID=1843537 RepID=A0AAE1TNP3_9EUCA|nr:hypothetical protein Pmani_037099 [Petrolisthes manimaculis]
MKNTRISLFCFSARVCPAGEESAAAVQSGCGSAQASVVAVLVGVGAVWWCCGPVWASLGLVWAVLHLSTLLHPPPTPLSTPA